MVKAKNIIGLRDRLISLMKSGEQKQDFAARIGIHPVTLSDILKNEALSTDTAVKISDSTGCLLDWLVKGTGDKFLVYKLEELPRADGRPPVCSRGPGSPAGDPIYIDQAEAVRVGQKTERALSDRDLAALAASYIIDSGLPKHDRERLADLVRQAFTDPELRRLLIDAFDLHRLRQGRSGP